jgi:murein DD-endopeptidase MepM/ murein hydrolase activator NlpD
LVFVFLPIELPSAATGTITTFGYHFARTKAEVGGWRGALAVPLDIEAGEWSVVIDLGGRTWTRSLDVEARSFRRSELSVQKKFTAKKQPKAVRARIERESEAWQRMLETKASAARPLAPPARPAAGERTSEFGVERVLNGVVESQHYGLDLDGKVGDPVVAVQAGRVVLVAQRFYSGGTIVLDHGHGLYSAYFHLSQLGRKVGERLSAGEGLGAVGKSGRVTGPHLHLALFVRGRREKSGVIRGLYVDPEPWLDAPWQLPRSP